MSFSFKGRLQSTFYLTGQTRTPFQTLDFSFYIFLSLETWKSPYCGIISIQQYWCLREGQYSMLYQRNGINWEGEWGINIWKVKGKSDLITLQTVGLNPEAGCLILMQAKWKSAQKIFDKHLKVHLSNLYFI